MYEELYAPIPDLKKYFERLGMKDPEVRLTREFLDELIYAHQTHIAFEDLDCCYYHVPISLSVPDLFDKIITKKRGGFCFELNGLFAALLKTLGFQADSVFCRIVNGRDFIPACTHRGTIVTLNGEKLYCDVGYGGPQPAASVLLSPGTETICCGEPFQVRDFDPYWYILSRTGSDGVTSDVLHISRQPQTMQEFIPAAWYCSTYPEMVFVKNAMINRRTDDGNVNITGDVFAERKGGVRTEKKLESWEETREILREKFFIEVP